jgi:mycothiol synthase
MGVAMHRAPRSPRPYAGADDLPAVLDLLGACLAADEASCNLSVAELRLVLPRPSVGAARNARLWAAPPGGLAAFGLLWPPLHNLVVLVHPDARPGGLGDDVLAWLLRRGREAAREEGRPLTLQARPHERDAWLLGLLRRHGFAEADWHTPRYARSLARPVPRPAAPDGFTLRAVRGEAEAAATAALHREAFGTPGMTTEARLARMRDPGYRPDLDLVAVAPDGELAAFVGGGLDAEASARCGLLVGYTDPLGTRPAYRRLGLARALLLEALGRLRAAGAVEARVGTGSWNTATRALLESVGYELAYRVLAYTKDVG